MRPLFLSIFFIKSFAVYACDFNQAQFLASEIDETESRACEILDHTFDGISQYLQKNNYLELPNFGHFANADHMRFSSDLALSNVLREKNDFFLGCENALTVQLMERFQEGLELSCYYLKQSLGMIVSHLKTNPSRDFVIPNFGRFWLDTQTTLRIQEVPEWFPHDIHIDFSPL